LVRPTVADEASSIARRTGRFNLFDEPRKLTMMTPLLPLRLRVESPS